MESKEDEALLSFAILETAKLAQTQHGLRALEGGADDYNRYRQYCARRIARVRKGVKLPQGRREYKKRLASVERVKASADARYIELAFMLVERVWAHSMHLKEQESDENTRPGVHHRRRLAKAARLSDELVTLCRETANTRTQLEAEAYSGWVHGNNHMERGELVLSLARFKQARAVFVQLGKVSDIEQQALCQERVQQIDPSIRLIEYDLAKLKRAGYEFSEADQAELLALQEEAEGDELLQRRLDEILAESRKREAETMSTVTWQGRRVPVKNERLRVGVIEAQQLAARAAEGGVGGGGGHERAVELHSGVMSAYDDALALARADIREAEKSLVKKNAMEHLEALRDFVTFHKLVATDARNRAMAAGMIEQYEQQRRGEQAVQTKKVRPDDLVHLYDRMLQNLDAAAEVAARGEAAEPLPASHAARRAGYVASRCFYLAESYRRTSQLAEAYALFGRARELAEAAGEGDLAKEAAARQSLVQVEDLQKRSGGAARKEGGQQQGKKDRRTLAERADDYSAGPAKEHHRLVDLPEDYVAVPGKPVVFDLAFNSVAFPSVAHRLRDEVKKKQEKPAAPAADAGGGGGGGGGWFGFLRGGSS